MAGNYKGGIRTPKLGSSEGPDIERLTGGNTGGSGEGGRGGGSTRTTRTGTPRTSTNTSAPSRRTSPGQRNTVNKQGEKTLKTWREFDSYGNGRQARKGKQVMGGLASYYGRTPKIDKKIDSIGSKYLSPKKSRQLVDMYKTQGDARGTKIKKFTSSPKQMKDARVAARKGK